MYKSQHELLGSVGLDVLDMQRRKREKKGADALRLFGLRESWRKKKLTKAKSRQVSCICCDLMSRVWNEEKKKEKMKKWKERPFGVRFQRKWGLSAGLKNCLNEWACKGGEKNRESKRKLWEIYSEKESND